MDTRMRRALDEARNAASEGRWSDAASQYAELSARAEADRDVSTAQQCRALQGDALRRDDRPAAAAVALERALDLLPSQAAGLSERRLVALVELSGVLVDAGALSMAADRARSAAAGASSAAGRTLALDALVGALVALGRVDEARAATTELAAVAPPAARIAVDFRRAILHRLDGELTQARALNQRVQAEAAGRPGLEGPAAAAAANLGELALLEGDGAAAAGHFEVAGRAWTAAGRRAGLFRSEAGLVRAALAQGATPLAAGLEGPARYARERQLPLLEVDVLLARGEARARAVVSGAEDDLDRAVALAEDCGAVLIEGRARVVRRRCGILRGDQARARLCLTHDTVWGARVDG